MIRGLILTPTLRILSNTKNDRGGMPILDPFFSSLATVCYVRMRDRRCQSVLHTIVKRFEQTKYYQYWSLYFYSLKLTFCQKWPSIGRLFLKWVTPPLILGTPLLYYSQSGALFALKKGIQDICFLKKEEKQKRERELRNVTV